MVWARAHRPELDGGTGRGPGSRRNFPQEWVSQGVLDVKISLPRSAAKMLKLPLDTRQV